MNIPDTTPLFKPGLATYQQSSALMSSKINNKDLKRDWYAYVDSLYTHDKIPACQALIDYNIASHKAPLSLNDMILLARVAMNIYQDLCPQDFIGSRLRKIYEMSSKDEEVKNYMLTMTYIISYQQNGLDFLLHAKEPGFIQEFYSNNPSNVTELFHTQIYKHGVLTEESKYIAEAVYNPLYVQQMSSMSDTDLTKHMGCILKVSECLGEFLDMQDDGTTRALETIFALNEIADLIKERGLVKYHDPLELPNFTNDATLLDKAFSTRYPVEYKQYAVLKTLDLNTETIWSMITACCHDIDAVNFTDIEV